MPTYEWTGSGTFRVGGDGSAVEPGETVELPEHAGEPHPELRRVDEGVAETQGDSSAHEDRNPQDDESGDSGEAEPEPTDGSDDADAADEADSDGADEAFDAEAVREEHWQTVVNDIEAGEYDGHLDELAEVDDRKSVQEAIDSRQTDG